MKLKQLWRYLTHALFTEPSTPTLFNPYSDRHEVFDQRNAIAIRRANLRNYLALYTERPPLLLVGEAPGPNGCRFSGVPFSSEHQLLAGVLPFRGKASSKGLRPCKETSATLYWNAIQGFERQTFAWNCVPFHPHRAGEPLSIRAPTLAEIRRYAPLLRQVIALMQPQRVVAIGNQAARALRELTIAAEQVRHPSHGGARQFKAGIRQVLLLAS
jgi:uracil-DNA glycosylase